MAKLTDDDIVAIVNQEFDDALGAPGGDISQLRAAAYDYYLRKAFPDDDPNDGNSHVVTSDVMEIVDGIMPSLLRIFTTAENVVSFDPVGAEDEEQAQLESDYVNHVFFKENNSFEILFFWMFDALVQIVGTTKAWWDESEVVNVETYQGLSEDEMLMLLSDDELELIERDEREAETIDDLTGQVVMATVHDFKVKRRSKLGRCRVGNVPPEEYRISSDVRSLSPAGVRLVGQEREAITRSDLTRQILMNLYHSNNPGTAVWEQALGENTMDDLLTTRVASVKRFARPLPESFAPIVVPYTAGQSYPMLELWDKTKRDRTGVSSDSQGLTPEALKNIQNSVLVAAMDMSRMK